MSERERIGTRLAEIRKEKGLTIRALSELSGVTNQYINKIENEKHSVGIDMLLKITTALGCRIEIIKVAE